MSGKFFKVFEQVIQKSRAFFFFFLFAQHFLLHLAIIEICLNLEDITVPTAFWNRGCLLLPHPTYTGFWYRSELSLPPYCHLQTISPYFLLEKKKKIPSSFEAYRISGCVACCPSLLQSSAHLQSPICTCFLGGVGPCLTASLSRITPASFWAASTSAEDTGLTSNGLVLYLTSATCSQGQTLGLVMTNNNCIISEIIFLSFLLSDHRLLSFQLNSLGPNTQVVPPFQGDLQPVDSTVPEYPSSFSSLLTHLRFHGPSL